MIFAPPAGFVPPTLRQTKSRYKRRWLTRVVWLALLALMAASLVVIFPWLRKEAASLATDLTENEHTSLRGNLQNFREMNFSFNFPEADWKNDDKARTGLIANMALHRSEPDGWMAVRIKDYKTRSPRAGELVDEAVHGAGDYFQNFEWEQKGDTKLAEHRTQRLVFQGEADNQLMSGECHILAYKGIAYWLMTWAPAAEAQQEGLQKEFGELRSRFSLLKERESWTEKRPPARIFNGVKAAYQLRDSEALWEKWATPEDADPLADLLLRGRDRIQSEDVDKMAQIMVLVLKPQRDLAAAVTEAKKYLSEQQKREYPSTTMEVISTKQGKVDGPAAVGNAEGHIVQFHIKNGENRKRFVILAVVHQAQEVLVIECECAWNHRSLWERDFSQLIGTFSRKPK